MNSALSAADDRKPAFVCPRCRQPVALHDDEYVCTDCQSRYPILLGIPDFRVAPDPWIGIEEDRAKGLALEESTQGADLEATVRAYWAMTPDTPRERAEHFIRHVMQAERRAGEWLTEQSLDAATSLANPVPEWLDVGCGTADLSVAAHAMANVTGIDVAFRWLVVARRRLMQNGLPVRLVCCNAEALPFVNDSFDRVLSLSAIEHVSGQRQMLSECHRILRQGASLNLRTMNRYSLLPEPHVGVLGVGWLPRQYADRYVHRRTGQRYLHHRLLGAHELRSMMSDAGFNDVARLGGPNSRFGAR